MTRIPTRQTSKSSHAHIDRFILSGKSLKTFLIIELNKFKWESKHFIAYNALLILTWSLERFTNFHAKNYTLNFQYIVVFLLLLFYVFLLNFAHISPHWNRNLRFTLLCSYVYWGLLSRLFVVKIPSSMRRAIVYPCSTSLFKVRRD